MEFAREEIGFMGEVVSRDGTRIAFDRSGTGPAVILVTGALGGRGGFAPLVALLAPRFRVVRYDRRGRGDSGDTPPYAVAREVEDLEAMLDETGGAAFVYGISSGAVLALEAASRLPAKVAKLALYERGEAVELFMTKAVGLPGEAVAPIRQAPYWPGLEAVAHTLAYDGTIMGDTMFGKPLPPARVARWATAAMPTLVIDGGESEPFFHHAAEAVAAILPDARRCTLAGQHHAVAPEALAPVLVEFFAGNTPPEHA
jgi:pimeloyl-ACP methyl ester carboxylesterase